MPSSRGSSQPRNWTELSYIAGRFFTIWAIREPQEYWVGSLPLLQGNFLTRNWTRVSYIAGGFFTSWATGKPQSGLTLWKGLNQKNDLKSWRGRGSARPLWNWSRALRMLKFFAYRKFTFLFIFFENWEPRGEGKKVNQLRWIRIKIRILKSNHLKTGTSSPCLSECERVSEVPVFLSVNVCQDVVRWALATCMLSELSMPGAVLTLKSIFSPFSFSFSELF